MIGIGKDATNEAAEDNNSGVKVAQKQADDAVKIATINSRAQKKVAEIEKDTQNYIAREGSGAV